MQVVRTNGYLCSKDASRSNLIRRWSSVASGYQRFRVTANTGIDALTCLPDKGPIPVGTYYIVDRQSGGIMGGINDALKRDWLALYAKDRVIDDQRWCAGVQRGQFRLHPKGSRGLSQGCITLERQQDFSRLRELLRCTTMESIRGSELMTYGTVVVS